MNNKTKTFTILVITLMVAAIVPSFVYARDTCYQTRGHWQPAFFNDEGRIVPTTSHKESTLVVEEYAIHYGDLSFTKEPFCSKAPSGEQISVAINETHVGPESALGSTCCTYGYAGSRCACPHYRGILAHSFIRVTQRVTSVMSFSETGMKIFPTNLL